MRRREQDVAPGPGSPATGPDAAQERDPQFITALARGLEVLRAFRKGDPHLGNQELAKRTGLPKPTLSRITYTLSKLGYLQYLPDIGKYRLSVGVLALGYSSLGSFGFRDVVRPLMQELANDTGISVALGTRDRLAMVYLEVCKGENPFQLALETGSHLRLGTSSMGRAYMAARTDEERAALYAQLEVKEGERWPAVREGLEEARSDLTRLGYVASIGEWKYEVNAAAVAVRVDYAGMDLAINCGGPTFLVSPDRLHSEIGPKLVLLAARIKSVIESNP